MNQWGHFSQDGREFIVSKPNTPRPWINYLTNGRYCALCSQTGGGYSFIGDPGYNRITRGHPGDEIYEDRPGRYIYVHEMKTKRNWSLNWQPVMATPELFETHVGQGYTKIISQNYQLKSEVTYFVPIDDDLEFWMVTLTNQTKHSRSFRLYSYVELTLGNFASDIIDRSFENLFNRTWFERNILFATKNRWETPSGEIKPWDKVAFMTVNVPVDGYETLKEAFVGQYHYLDKPEMVHQALLPHNAANSGETVAVLCLDVILKGGESVDLDFMLGAASDSNQAHALRQKYISRQTVQHSLDQVSQYWAEYNNHLLVNTPDPDFNTSVNIWNRYQCWVTSLWSEMDSYYISGSGTYGFRDEAQHIFGMLPHSQSTVKGKLQDLLIHQLVSGLTVHNWDTYSKKGPVTHHSDDPQWLVLAIINYVKETGDLGYLNERYPYYDSGDGEVIEHLTKALDYTLTRTSQRGITLRQTADWNDALGGSSQGRGESMMVANQLAWNLREMMPIWQARNDQMALKHYQEHYDKLAAALNRFAWDGQWYLRATDDDGKNIGSHLNKEGMIYLNAQTWPIISGIIGETDRGTEIMDQVWKKLMTPFGPAIFLPPYTQADPNLGIITQFTPGTKENGTIFLHPTSWAVIAECLLGRGDQAYDIWQRTLFINRGRDPRYKSEPYVYPEYIYGPSHPKYGQGSYTWITGSAAWYYRACTDWILGVKPTLAGLIIDPVVPKKWDHWSIERDFRQARYLITVNNPKKLNRGINHLTVDGQMISGNLIPDFQDQKTHTIEAVLEN